MVLNPDKSEVIIMGIGNRLRSLDTIDKISVAGASIQPAACLKRLGVLVDSTLSMNKHVNSICRSVNYYIRALRHVRLATSADAANKIA